MSAYIVTETGLVIEYPNCNYIKWLDEECFCCCLYKGHPDRYGRLLGWVPNGCVVSFDQPKLVHQASKHELEDIPNHSDGKAENDSAGQVEKTAGCAKIPPV